MSEPHRLETYLDFLGDKTVVEEDRANWSYKTLQQEVVWQLLNLGELTVNGSYKAIYFLYIVLSTGQGAIIFSMFVADYDLIIAPVGLFLVKIKEQITESIKKLICKHKPATEGQTNKATEI